MNTITKILQDVIQLPEDQRLALANRLLMLSEPYASDDIKNAWDTEIRERIARYDRGEIKSKPAHDVFSELTKRLNR